MMKGKLENKAFGKAPENKGRMPVSHTEKPAKGEAARIKAESTKVMTMQQWEKSATDAAMDRKVAKREGLSLRQYEGSKLDEGNDRKQLAAHNAKAKAAKKGA